MIGKTFAHYEITSQLGKGGMGEVYRAKDQKLGRDVAIKVLPEEFSRDTDRVARFQREAKLLASLNHTNIASIYGLEESVGTQFLVLELVEGDTLADQIKRGPIPVEESLKLALQIAEALDAAHEKGVIHRDLKPANIKVTPEGKVKVLDFGLAKAFAGEQEQLNLSNSPTLSDMATMQGVILGTAAYMSPEQARGKPVDKRADIWALGCVLYEMLTGQAAFQGEDVTEILAAVVKSGADLNLLPANIHLRIREAIIRCLQKDLKKRYGDIADARYEIEQALADPGDGWARPIAGTEPRMKFRMVLLWAASLALMAIIAGVAVWVLKPSESKKVMRFEYELPAGQQFNRHKTGATTQYQFAISPDGSSFVYCTTEGLYLHSMSALDSKHIAETDKDSAQPFFSPDGQWIGYFSRSDKKLKKAAIGGGAPEILCDIDAAAGDGSWDLGDTVVYVDGGIMRVSANGGKSEKLSKRSSADIAKEGRPFAPQMLPDGKTLLFSNVAGTSWTDREIVAQSLRSGERKVLAKGVTGGRYISTGHIVYTQSNNLLAIPFDLNKLKVTGSPVSILEGLSNFAFSKSGTLVYIPTPAIATESASASPEYTLVWVDKEGKEDPILTSPGRYLCLRISPDKSRLALAYYVKGNEDIWVLDLSRKTMTRLTIDEAKDYTPIWTPDSRWIVFGSARNDKFGIYRKAADGTGEVEQLYSLRDREIWPWSWSGDRKSLLLTEAAIVPMQSDIAILSMEADRGRKPLLSEKYFESDPQISSNGRWIAYTSDESGQNEIYVRPFPDINLGKWQVSTNGGISPLWSPDSRELFYRKDDATLAVMVGTGSTFMAGNPKILFQGTYFSYVPYGTSYTPWDISPDGKRFIMVKSPQPTQGKFTDTGGRKINIVLNWTEELKQRVPVK